MEEVSNPDKSAQKMKDDVASADFIIENFYIIYINLLFVALAYP